MWIIFVPFDLLDMRRMGQVWALSAAPRQAQLSSLSSKKMARTAHLIGKFLEPSVLCVPVIDRDQTFAVLRRE
jgi:hypothetical protein